MIKWVNFTLFTGDATVSTYPVHAIPAGWHCTSNIALNAIFDDFRRGKTDGRTIAIRSRNHGWKPLNQGELNYSTVC